MDKDRKVEFLPYELDLLNKLALAANALAEGAGFVEDGYGWRRQRHAMGALGFHARRRNDPKPVIEVNFVPDGLPDLARPRCGQDEELQRQLRRRHGA